MTTYLQTLLADPDSGIEDVLNELCEVDGLPNCDEFRQEVEKILLTVRKRTEWLRQNTENSADEPFEQSLIRTVCIGQNIVDAIKRIALKRRTPDPFTKAIQDPRLVVDGIENDYQINV